MLATVTIFLLVFECFLLCFCLVCVFFSLLPYSDFHQGKPLLYNFRIFNDTNCTKQSCLLHKYLLMSSEYLAGSHDVSSPIFCFKLTFVTVIKIKEIKICHPTHLYIQHAYVNIRSYRHMCFNFKLLYQANVTIFAVYTAFWYMSLHMVWPDVFSLQRKNRYTV